jgi:hypothetical protein
VESATSVPQVQEKRAFFNVQARTLFTSKAAWLKAKSYQLEAL